MKNSEKLLKFWEPPKPKLPNFPSRSGTQTAFTARDAVFTIGSEEFPVTDVKFIADSIRNMSGFGDPKTFFVSPQTFAEFQTDMRWAEVKKAAREVGKSLNISNIDIPHHTIHGDDEDDTKT